MLEMGALSLLQVKDWNSMKKKKLTDADLQRSPTSHGAHIGLIAGMTKSWSLDEKERNYECYFKDFGSEGFVMCNAFIQRIKNPDGTFRSPRLKRSDGVDETDLS